MERFLIGIPSKSAGRSDNSEDKHRPPSFTVEMELGPDEEDFQEFTIFLDGNGYMSMSVGALKRELASRLGVTSKKFKNDYQVSYRGKPLNDGTVSLIDIFGGFDVGFPVKVTWTDSEDEP